MSVATRKIGPKEIVGGLAVGLLVVWWMARGSGPADPPRPPVTPLDAAVRQAGLEVVVTNREAQPWRECTLEINSDWSVRQAALEPGRSVTLALADFTKSDGSRFNLMTTKPQRISIACRQAPDRFRMAIYGWG